MKKIFRLIIILSVLFVVPVYAVTSTTATTKHTYYYGTTSITTIANKTGAKLEDNSGYTNLCTRSLSNQYGVTKKTKNSLESLLQYIKATPCVDANDKIYDFSDILTPEEESLYQMKFLEYKKKYNLDIVFVSYNLPYTYDNDNLLFADDFYRFNDFGKEYDLYDGILIFRNTYASDPFYTVITEGGAQLYLDGSRLSSLEDDLYDYFSNKRYPEGIDKVLARIEKYYSKDPIKGKWVDEYGDIHKYWYPTYGAYAFWGIVVGLIYMGIGLGKHKMVKKAKAAREYLVKDSLNLTEKNDLFLRSHTSSYTVSSSSGGGGGGSFHGHSGGGFSSGGGRHG